MTILPIMKLRVSILIGFAVLAASCRDRSRQENNIAQQGIASLQDGALFESFCSLNLANADADISWEQLRNNLEQSARTEPAFRELDEIGEIGVSKNGSTWVIVLLGDQVVQVYSNGKVTCFEKKQE